MRELSLNEMITIDGGGPGDTSGDIVISGNNYVGTNNGTLIQNSSPVTSTADLNLILDILSNL